MLHLLGIDPGVSGAIAYICRGDDGRVTQIEIIDLPTVSIDFGTLLDTNYLHRQLEDRLPRSRFNQILIEEPLSVKQLKTSATAIKTSLVNLGRLQVVLEGFTGKQDWQTVTPSTWKKSLGLSKDKRESLMMARRIFGCNGLLKYKKDHDRAEALLLTEYAYRQLVAAA